MFWYVLLCVFMALLSANIGGALALYIYAKRGIEYMDKNREQTMDEFLKEYYDF